MTIEEIQDLFNRARTVCANAGNVLEGAEITIFRAVYPDRGEASERLGGFLLDVGTCPPEVIEYTQTLIKRVKERGLAKL